MMRSLFTRVSLWCVLLLVGVALSTPWYPRVQEEGTQQGGVSVPSTTQQGTTPTRRQAPPSTLCVQLTGDPNGLVINATTLVQGISLRSILQGLFTSLFGPPLENLCGDLTTFIQWNINQSFLFSTGAGITYADPTVLKYWSISLGIALGALALVLLVGGYQIMAGASASSVLPRIFLTVLALLASYPIMEHLIDLESAISTGFLAGALVETPGEQLTLLQSLTGGGVGATGNVLNFMAALLIEVLLLAVFLQMLVRIALLDVLIAIAPIALLCYALPSWQRWSNLWISAFLATLFVQMIQMVAIGLASDLISTLGGPEPIGLLVGLAALVLLLKIPGWLGSAVTSTLAGVPSPYSLAVSAAQTVGTGALQVIKLSVSTLAMIEV